MDAASLSKDCPATALMTWAIVCRGCDIFYRWGSVGMGVWGYGDVPMPTGGGNHRYTDGVMGAPTSPQMGRPTGGDTHRPTSKK